jgi:hypothetical protein
MMRMIIMIQIMKNHLFLSPWESCRILITYLPPGRCISHTL